MEFIKDYEMICGLEVHAELKTETKIFCGCKTTFGAPQNTQCCPVCMGMPGTLPMLNRKVVDLAIKAGLAVNCKIAGYSKQDRKNYFYPDLPKAYQISQYDLPLCEGGWLEIDADGTTKRIGITRIHIEEDAGKLIHDEENGTMIDCNRCGVPLIEIVSEPDIRSAEEAAAYVKKLRSILLYAGVSDCRMNEGSLRCDVNLSVRRRGETKFGTRTEMKNINSFTFIQKAIEFEYRRQVELIEAGGKVIQETRRFDQTSGETFSMRKKEDANDYRYFPEPDLPPIVTTKEQIERLRSEIPKLPDVRKLEYMENYGLTDYDAEMIVASKNTADYFETAAGLTKHPKLAANLLISDLIGLLPPEIDEITIPINPEHLASVAEMAGNGTINSSVAKKLMHQLVKQDDDPVLLVKQQGLEQISDPAVLTKLVNEAIAADTKSSAAYRSGNAKAFMALMGRVMGKTAGKGNPVLIKQLLEEALNFPDL